MATIAFAVGCVFSLWGGAEVDFMLLSEYVLLLAHFSFALALNTWLCANPNHTSTEEQLMHVRAV